MGDKSGTRVFKKSSSTGNITVYLGKRDFVDHLDYMESLDGVVLIDPTLLSSKQAFVTLTCAFRYGREDLDVLGLTFRKDLFVTTLKVYPPSEAPDSHLEPSHLQERLLRKLGPGSFPFTFQIPQSLPCSVTLQPGPEDTGKACGVDYEIKAFCGDRTEEKSDKWDTVRLVIRKVQFAPERPGPQPRAEATRQFMMSDEPLHIEASLDKAIYYHGKPISINVHIRNHTMKTVRRIIISVRQYTDICLFNTAQYKCSVASEEADISVGPSSTLCKVFTLTPLLSNNRNKQGLALDGKLKHEDTNLASSTVWQEGANKDMLGILVSYRVKVKALTWRAGVPRGLSVELPFTLMHPKPPVQSPEVEKMEETGDKNLIEFDTNSDEVEQQDEDIVFENFARQRLNALHM
uniref:beta-arrestin-1-like n=1 Tax=Myxine glutinosa TaxID=7769 RepID=UPI00358EA86B